MKKVYHIHIEKYIREQEMEDQMADQLSFKEYEIQRHRNRDLKQRQSAVGIAHCTPLGVAGILPLQGVQIRCNCAKEVIL